MFATIEGSDSHQVRLPSDSKDREAGEASSAGLSVTEVVDSASDSRKHTLKSHSETLETSSTASVELDSKVNNSEWLDMFKGKRATMKKKGTPFLMESGELCVQIPNEVITRNEKKWEAFIIGQFHGNLPPRGALHAILNGIWSSKARDITMSKLGPKTVLIRIPCPSTRQRVLRQGVWHIEGQTMFVAKWEPGLKPSMPELTQVPVWLEFKGVPLQFFNEEGLEHVAGALGHPLYLHPSTADLSNVEVAKVFTIINPSIPLPEMMNVQFESGETHRVEVLCPWLPPTCSHCNEIGHSIRRCPTAPITCPPCKSSAHLQENCPRAKKKSSVVPAQEDLTPSTNRKNPARRRKTRVKSVAISTEVDEKRKGKQIAKAPIDSAEGTSKKSKNLTKKIPPAPTSSSSSSESSESERSEEDSSDSSSEQEDNLVDDSRFATKISKKQRRFEKRVSGNHPNKYLKS